jgi:hypothetical protein
MQAWGKASNLSSHVPPCSCRDIGCELSPDFWGIHSKFLNNMFVSLASWLLGRGHNLWDSHCGGRRLSHLSHRFFLPLPLLSLQSHTLGCRHDWGAVLIIMAEFLYYSHWVTECSVITRLCEGLFFSLESIFSLSFCLIVFLVLYVPVTNSGQFILIFTLLISSFIDPSPEEV